MIIFDKMRLVGASTIELPIIGATPEGPFIMKGSDGLGPPEIDVFMGEKVGEGAFRQGRRAQNRQAVIRIGLQPSWNTGQTPAELRNWLYDLITPKSNKPVKMQVVLGNTVIAEAQGDISKFEMGLFTKDPEVQITLECDSPYLVAPTPKSQVPTKSMVGGKMAIDIQNNGNAPTGFWMGIVLQSPQSGALILSDDEPDGLSMTFNGPWNTGDTFAIDTRPGSRGIWRTASGSGQSVSALGRMTGNSPWLMLSRGNNRLLLNNTVWDWGGTPFVHTETYWGV